MNLKQKNKNYIRIGILFLFVISSYIAYSYFYQEHKKVAKMTPSYQGNAEIFKDSFFTSTEKWSGKVVVLSGNISSLDDQGLMLNETFFCQLHPPPSLKEGTQLTIKGRLAGYDDLLEEIKLDECVILE